MMQHLPVIKFESINYTLMQPLSSVKFYTLRHILNKDISIIDFLDIVKFGRSMNIFRISVNRLQTAADCGPQRKDCSCGTYQKRFFKFNKNLPLHAAAFLGGYFLR